MVAWCAILWKYIKIRLAIRRLKIAKRNAYRKSIGLPPIFPIWERPFRWIWGMLKGLCIATFCRCCRFKKNSNWNWSRLCRKGSLPNEVGKNILGFVAGAIFSKLLLDFTTTQLNFHAQTVYWVTVLFGLFLTIGMTFSDTVRCLFTLGVPQLFTSKGRTALLAYVIILALSGPGKNITKNMEVLTTTMVCGQDMVQNSTQELVQLATDPLSTLKMSIQIIINAVKGVLRRMKSELFGVLELIFTVINTIKEAYDMLKNITDMCNKKLGSPFQRCNEAFEKAKANCMKEVKVEFVCSPVDLSQKLCHISRVVEVLCWLPSLAKLYLIDPLKQELKRYFERFSEYFNVPLNVTYDFDHELKSDKSFRQVIGGIKDDIMENVNWFLSYIDLTDLFISWFMFLVVWKAMTYRYKFLNSDEYDNFYISRGMIRMDLRRRKINKASIFPLKYSESQKFVQTYSCTLVKEEKITMFVAMSFVTLAAIQTLHYILLDFALFLFLSLIREYGITPIDTKELLGLSYTIEGEGFLAEMYRTILDGLSPVGGILPTLDISNCLPNPHEPNYHEYMVIAVLILVCYVFSMLEPYGLRLRHIVCGWLYEKRVLEREIWLYQHILSTRDNFMDFAKGQIRARLKGDRTVYQISIMDRLYHMLPCCKRLFKTRKKKCFLCGRPGEFEDFENFMECPNCKTVYCRECSKDMGKLGDKCLACMKKMDYAELSQDSEELGSDSDENSDEDRDLIEICCNRICSCYCCRGRRNQRSKPKQIPKDRGSTSKRRFENVQYKNLNEKGKGRGRRKSRSSGSKKKPSSKSKVRPKTSKSKTSKKPVSPKRKTISKSVKKSSTTTTLKGKSRSKSPVKKSSSALKRTPSKSKKPIKKRSKRKVTPKKSEGIKRSKSPLKKKSSKSKPKSSKSKKSRSIVSLPKDKHSAWLSMGFGLSKGVSSSAMKKFGSKGMSRTLGKTGRKFRPKSLSAGRVARRGKSMRKMGTKKGRTGSRRGKTRSRTPRRRTPTQRNQRPRSRRPQNSNRQQTRPGKSQPQPQRKRDANDTNTANKTQNENQRTPQPQGNPQAHHSRNLQHQNNADKSQRTNDNARQTKGKSRSKRHSTNTTHKKTTTRNTTTTRSHPKQGQHTKKHQQNNVDKPQPQRMNNNAPKQRATPTKTDQPRRRQETSKKVGPPTPKGKTKQGANRTPMNKTKKKHPRSDKNREPGPSSQRGEKGHRNQENSEPLQGNQNHDRDEGNNNAENDIDHSDDEHQEEAEQQTSSGHPTKNNLSIIHPTYKSRKGPKAQQGQDDQDHEAGDGPQENDATNANEDGHDDEDDNDEGKWWNRDPATMQQDKFRCTPKHIASSIRERVEFLDAFYRDQRFPPCCNL